MKLLCKDKLSLTIANLSEQKKTSFCYKTCHEIKRIYTDVNEHTEKNTYDTPLDFINGFICQSDTFF